MNGMAWWWTVFYRINVKIEDDEKIEKLLFPHKSVKEIQYFCFLAADLAYGGYSICVHVQLSPVRFLFTYIIKLIKLFPTT